MKIIQQFVWDAGDDLSYYSEQLGWPVKTWEELAELVKDNDETEMRFLFGWCDSYTIYAQEGTEGD